MIAYHATKNKGRLEAILKTSILLPGRNIATEELFVHIALKPFGPGEWKLDVIDGAGGWRGNQAWIVEFEIPDDTKLLPDPSGEGEENGWVVHHGPLTIRVLNITYVTNVVAWERQMTFDDYAEDDWRIARLLSLCSSGSKVKNKKWAKNSHPTR